MLTITLRESRLILERLVQAAGAPPGMLIAMRDCAFYSAVLAGPGFAAISGQLELLRECGVKPLRVLREQPELVVDCDGQHAWQVADALTDLAVDLFRRTGIGTIIAHNVVACEELRVVAGLAERMNLSASAIMDGDSARVSVAARSSTAPSVLDQVRNKGVTVEAAVWWSLYHASHDALAPDSFESRRHAGTIRVEADGRIIGRNDEDETDLSLLTSDASRLRAGTTASAI